LTKVFARIIGGSLTGGLEAHILKGFSSEDVRIGSITIVQGRKYLFLALISNIKLNPGSDIASSIVRGENGFSEDMRLAQNYVADGLKREGVLGAELSLIPVAIFRDDRTEIADSLPELMSLVRAPGEEDLKLFYGGVDHRRFWDIGLPKSPITAENVNVHIPIDVDRLVRGCFAIFGKSGTGKTFLGNLIATYIVLANISGAFEKKVKLLIFDMHSEYGLMVKDQKGDEYAEGVGLAFKSEFLRYTPDMALAKECNLEPFKVNYRRITISDLLASGDALGLTRNFMDLLPSFVNYLKSRGFKSNWLKAICGFIELSDDEKVRKELRERFGIGALSSLLSARARLQILKRFEFISWGDDEEEDSASNIIQELLDGYKHVIVSFGRYGDNRIAYMLITNIIARRLWMESIRRIMMGKQLNCRVTIFLEEAHKFLGPKFYYMTPFGDIARELRKRGIILCIIDQRPSQIFEDVRAMLWNNFVMCLTDEKDVEAASKGLPFPRLFKPIIENLKRREVLIFGEAISIPSIVRVKDYKITIRDAKKFYEKRLSEDESSKLMEQYGYGVKEK